MSIFSLLGLLCRLIGLISLAEHFYARHEKKVANNAQSEDIRLSDDAVADKLRKQYSRD